MLSGVKFYPWQNNYSEITGGTFPRQQFPDTGFEECTSANVRRTISDNLLLIAENC